MVQVYSILYMMSKAMGVKQTKVLRLVKIHENLEHFESQMEEAFLCLHFLQVK